MGTVAIFPLGKMTSTKSDSLETLGARVRDARKRQGLDQVTAAGLCGVSPRWLGELERGKENQRIGLVLQVLGRLGLEVWVGPRGTDE